MQSRSEVEARQTKRQTGLVTSRKPLKATRKAVDEAMATEGLTRARDRAKVAEGLRAVLDVLPPAPSSPLDAGIRSRLCEAAEHLGL